MNIFYVSKSPKEAAEFLPDKLIVKMPLESAQMLCTAHRIHSDEDWCDANGIYKIAYKNHPCTIWARTTSDNYFWLYSHFIALCSEYTRRYGKEHLSFTKLEEPLSYLPSEIKLGGLTKLPQAMPDEYKHENPVLAYRDYVIHEKHYAKWEKGRDKPDWWEV